MHDSERQRQFLHDMDPRCKGRISESPQFYPGHRVDQCAQRCVIVIQQGHDGAADESVPPVTSIMDSLLLSESSIQAYQNPLSSEEGTNCYLLDSGSKDDVLVPS